MKTTTFLQSLKNTLTVLALLTALALLGACEQKNENDSASITVKLPPSAVEQLNGGVKAASVGGDLSGITRITITVERFVNDRPFTIASKDILAAGGTLTFDVPPKVNLQIRGEAYAEVDGVDTLVFEGSTSVAALAPGSRRSVSFSLNPPAAAFKAVIGSVVTAGTVGTTTNGTPIQVLRVGDPEPIAEGVVNGGRYELQLPAGLVPSSDIIFRVFVDEGEGGLNPMDARYTSPAININPVTNAASTLVEKLVTIAESNLTAISVGEIQQIERIMNLLAKDLDPQALYTLQDYASLLINNLEADLETAHVASSSVAQGEICGKVTDNSNKLNPLEGITIVVRDFNTRIRRARTQTGPDGKYCVNVPTIGEVDVLTNLTASGEYIIGAVNQSGNSAAASQWWLADGSSVPLRIEAGKIALVEASNATANFRLPVGALIHGTVNADIGDGITEALAGIHVTVHDKATLFQLAGATTNIDGSYAISVPVGDYVLEARNSTTKPYATETYTTPTPDGATGTNNRNLGSVISLGENGDYQADFTLLNGREMTGTITDNGTPVTGVRVLVNNSAGGASTRLRVTRLGARNGGYDSYKVWLRPAIYSVYAYGQEGGADLETLLSANIDFAEPVVKLPVLVQHNNNNNITPVSKAKVRLSFSGDGIYLRSMDFSKSDGTLTVYSTASDLLVLEARAEGRQSFSSMIYDGQNALGAGNELSLDPTQPPSQVTFTLQNPGYLTGTVSDFNGDPVGNTLVEVYAKTGVRGGIYDRFVATRTRADGTYTLSLPEGVYDEIVFSDLGGSCQNISVIEGVTTMLDVSSSDGIVCSLDIPPLTIGGVTFDRTSSFDLSRHKSLAIQIPVDNQWHFNEYVSTGGTETRDYQFAKAIVNGVPVTEATELTNKFVDGVEALAVATDGAIYTLASQEGQGDPVDWKEPLLFLPPSSRLVQDYSWPSSDGGTHTVTQVGFTSPAGYSNTIEITTTYPQGSNKTDWVTYVRATDGIVEETDVVAEKSYMRGDVVPDIQAAAAGIVLQ